MHLIQELMAGKNKLKRWAEMKTFPNVYQPELEEVMDKKFVLNGQWNLKHFKNDNPIVLELGCGKGEYSVGLGRKFRNKNIIGIDVKGARMFVGAKQALDEKLDNVCFLRTRIEFITSFFAPDEISEIWITFPDPQLKDRRIKKRLTHRLFLDRYQSFLKENGIIHLKTDSYLLHEYTLEVIEEYNLNLLESTSNLYKSKLSDLDSDTTDILEIKTYYEELFVEKGCDITYLKFQLS